MCSIFTGIVVSFLTYLILPETLPVYFFMLPGMLLGCILGLACGLVLSLVNNMFNLALHTMFVGMLSGMMALLPARYLISVFGAFIVWLLLVISDEYYARISDKVRFELTPKSQFKFL